MKLQLSTGEADLRVYFDVENERRITVTLLTYVQPFWDITVTRDFCVTCSKNDNFSRKVGKKLVAEKVIKYFRDSYQLTKNDRKIIFEAICPEFKRKL